MMSPRIVGWTGAAALAGALMVAGPVSAGTPVPGGAGRLGDSPGRIEPHRVVPVPDPYGEPLEIDVWMRGGEDRTYRPGDRVTVYFRVNRDAFVLLYDVDTEGRVHQLYPRTHHDPEFVMGGVTYAVGRGAGYRLMVTGPPGREDIVALASDRPIAERWDYCWSGIAGPNDYDELGGRRLRMGHLGANRLRGMDSITQKLIEVPVEDDYSETAWDQVTFRVGHRHSGRRSWFGGTW